MSTKNLLRMKRASLTIALISALALVSGCSKQTDVELLASAQTFLAKEDRSAAIVQLKSALQLNPDMPEARFLLGQSYFDQGDAIAATVELEKALDLKFDDNLVLPALARSLLATGQAKKLVDTYGRTRLSDTKAHSALKTSVAEAYISLGQIERGQAATNVALQLDPNNVSARILQARFAAGRGRVDDALSSVELILKEFPRQILALQLKGELLWAVKNDIAGAADAYMQILLIEPRYIPAHAQLMAFAMQKQDLPAFRAQFEQLKKAMPSSLETRYFEAQIALLDVDLPRARVLTQQLLQSAPENLLVLQLAGTVELNGGSLILAESHLNKALQLQPQLVVVRQLLAQAYLRSGQAAKALTTLQPALSDKPSAAVLALAAEAHLQNGDLIQSETLFAKAAKENPSDAKVRTALALSLVAKGDVSRGLAELESISKSDPSSYADLALISSELRRQNHEGAMAAIDRLQLKSPAAALPHLLRGRALAQYGDMPSARLSFDKALAADPDYFPALANLAALDIAEKKSDIALKRFQDLLIREPKNYRALLAVAELKLQTGGPTEEVRNLLNDAVSASPGEVAPRLLLVDFLLSRSEPGPARAAAQNAVAALPTSLLLQDALGRAQLASGEVQQAISSFVKLAAEQPVSVPAHMRLAQAQAKNKDYSAATRSLKRVLEIDPTAVQAQSALVEVALADKRFEDAMEVTRDVQKQRPDAAEGYLLETEVHVSRQQWAQAVNSLQAAFQRQKITPTAIRLHTLMSLAGRTADADRLAAKWLLDQPEDAHFIFYLGAVAIDSRRFAEAENYYRRVLTLIPDSATAINNVAWLMTQQGKPGAVAYAEKALKLLPEQHALMDTLANALAAEGQLPQAIDWQRKALAKANNNASYRLRLAKMLVQTGDKTGARTELNTLAGLGDKFADHAEVLQLLKTL